MLFIRVPYYIEDPKRDPNLENYPRVKQAGLVEHSRIVSIPGCTL